jgi:hypothetical protein
MVKTKIKQYTNAVEYIGRERRSPAQGCASATLLTTVKMEVGSYIKVPMMSFMPLDEDVFEILWSDGSKTQIGAVDEEQFIQKVLDCGFGVYTIEIAI